MLRRVFQTSAVSAVTIAGYSAFRQYPENPLWAFAGDYLRKLDPEQAHNLYVLAAQYGLLPYDRAMLEISPETFSQHKSQPSLETRVWDLTFASPIGLAAGLDKDARAIDGLHMLGFGFVEIGTVTPKPQPGNPKPRMFRLAADKAVINRYGFNSRGLQYALERLQNFRAGVKARLTETSNINSWKTRFFPSTAFKHPIVGVNVGKNKASTGEAETLADFASGVATMAPVADYLVINISSPNTPGLRSLQRQSELSELIKRVKETRDALTTERKPPLLVKIAPDLTDEEKKDIAKVVTRLNVDGLIVSNTTISRPETLQSEPALTKETGGLSGAPLKSLALTTLRDMYKYTNGSVPLIGVGGIESAEDAYERIRAGASLVQLYTSLTYNGPDYIVKMKKQLANLLEKDGFSKVSDAVGADSKKK